MGCWKKTAFGLAVLAIVSPCRAESVFTGIGTDTINSTGLSATATFSTVQHDFGTGSTNALQIVLTNNVVTQNCADILTGVFFDAGKTPSSNPFAVPAGTSNFDGLAPTTVTLNSAGETVIDKLNVDVAPAASYSKTPLPGTLHGGYQLLTGFSSTPVFGVDYSTYDYGIGTVGLGLFSGSLVNGTPTQKGGNPDAYGVVGNGTDLSLDGLKNQVPLSLGYVTFWIKEPTNFTLSSISNVHFVYGSDGLYNFDGKPQHAPLPSALALLLSGVPGGFGLLYWRRRQQNAAV